MSILIKGMEMPDECAKCVFIDYYKGQWYCHAINDLLETGQSYKDERCPLVEVPTPHGRLKDVDVIIIDECHSCDGCCEVIECDCLNCTKAGCDTIRALNDAPTIIEAEE